jgi:hypothetical protein
MRIFTSDVAVSLVCWRKSLTLGYRGRSQTISFVFKKQLNAPSMQRINIYIYFSGLGCYLLDRIFFFLVWRKTDSVSHSYWINCLQSVQANRRVTRGRYTEFCSPAGKLVQSVVKSRFYAISPDFNDFNCFLPDFTHFRFLWTI